MVTTSEVLLKYTTDKQSLNKTLASEKALMKSQDKLADSIKDVNKETVDYTKSLQRLSKTDDLDDIAKSANRAEKEIRKADQATKDLSKSASIASDRFDQVSKDVALAGDVESNVRALGGAAGAAGLGGVEQVVGVGAEIPAAIEALPRLKEAAAGLPGTIKSAATSLGPWGVAMAAAGVITAIAAAKISKSLDAINDKVQANLDAQTRAFDIIATGSAETAASAIEDSKGVVNAREMERDALRDRINAANAMIDSLSAEERALLKAADALKETPLEQAEQRLKEVNKVISEETLLIEKLTDAFDENALAASGLTDQLLEEASMAGRLAAAEQEASTLSKEAIDERLKNIEREKAVLQAELAVLQASGDVSEEVTKRIDSLNKSLDGLSQEASVFENAASTAISEVADTVEDSVSKIEAANQKYADSIKQIKTQATNALQDARTKNKDAAKDLSKSLSDDLFEDIIKQSQEHSDTLKDSRREDLKDSRDHEKSLKKIQKDGAKSQRDAARNRDFLALAEAKEATQENVDNAIDERQSLRDERQIALDDKIVDLRQDNAITKAERLRSFERDRRDLGENLQRQFRDIHTSRTRQLKLAAEALSKELKLAADGANKALQIEQKFWQARLDLAAKAASVGSKIGKSTSRARQQTTSGASAQATALLAGMGMFD